MYVFYLLLLFLVCESFVCVCVVCVYVCMSHICLRILKIGSSLNVTCKSEHGKQYAQIIGARRCADLLCGILELVCCPKTSCFSHFHHICLFFKVLHSAN